jgi:hypothetical protein
VHHWTEEVAGQHWAKEVAGQHWAGQHLTETLAEHLTEQQYMEKLVE